AVAIARGGFEYQGQKCSAVSRVYVPRSIWNDVRERTVAIMRELRMGDVADFRNFVGAVIDQKALEKIGSYIAEAGPGARVGAGPRRGQLLRERQADGRGRRPAALRRRPRLRHQRQGRLEAQPRPMDQRAGGEGELRPAPRLPLPVHVRGVGGAQRPPSAWPE